MIRNEAELEEILSRPNAADLAFFRELKGDILILGVAGKMGPSLAHRAVRAAAEAGSSVRVTGVARFSDPEVKGQLESWGVRTIAADLLDDGVLESLPDAPNVIHMAARKFGTTGNAYLTWAMNTLLPARVAERYKASRIVGFSTGNVYPLLPITQGGATEATQPAPVGEYGQSALGRERLFEYFSARYGTPVTMLRLNYAIDLRYGVLFDIASKVFDGRPVDVSMGMVNVIWQGDANSITLRSLGHCSSPAKVLNMTGPETLSVRSLAHRFGAILGREPVIEGTEAPNALLNDASHCHRLMGYPEIGIEQMIEWTAEWVRAGGTRWDKPTHFETRDGKF